MGSLAGAAHLLNYNASVQKEAQRDEKSRVDNKVKSFSDFDFQ